GSRWAWAERVADEVLPGLPRLDNRVIRRGLPRKSLARIFHCLSWALPRSPIARSPARATLGPASECHGGGAAAGVPGACLTAMLVSLRPPAFARRAGPAQRDGSSTTAGWAARGASTRFRAGGVGGG